MKCSRCGIKTAKIAFIDEEGYYRENDLFCAECFIKEAKRVVMLATTKKGKEMWN